MTHENNDGKRLDDPELLESLTHYWRSQAGIFASRYVDNFNAFTRSCRGLVRRGDNEIKKFNAMGYNIILSPGEIPFTSNEKYIFYNNYIRRAEHFGILLGQMEYEGIITPEQVSFGVKASKVLYDEWPINPLDERIAGIRREDISRMKMIATSPGQEPEEIIDAVSKTVELVVVFRPQAKPEQGLSESDNAAQILNFLLDRCSSKSDRPIPESWEVPDIRATKSLADTFETIEELVIVKLNLFQQKSGNARLVIGKQTTSFGESRRDWITEESYMNEDLQVYLASPDFGVAP